MPIEINLSAPDPVAQMTRAGSSMEDLMNTAKQFDSKKED